jgi:DNA-binding NtrC family response regulator
MNDILIIDDDSSILEVYKSKFQEEGLKADIATSVDEAKDLFEKNKYRAALVDVYLQAGDTLKTMRDMISRAPQTRFFSFSGQDTIPLAVDAMSIGASGFFSKSTGPEKIVSVIRSKIRTRKEFDIDESDLSELGIVGQSAKMREVFSMVKKFSQVGSTVLVTGESGTGKEVVSKAIHKLSDRKTETYEAINCGAIPENLLESELFGHTRGAFTDAKTDKDGLFTVCSKGTLMLDEIGDMPMSLQVKLLRVLQEKEVRPVGSTKSVKVNPRIIACTHRDLLNLVKEGRFRQDLYFRLSVLELHVPALRERVEDIPALTNMFVARFNKAFGKNVNPPSNELMARLMNYSWPGNIRELQNAIERGVVLSKSNELNLEDILNLEEAFPVSTSEMPLTHKVAQSTFEKEYIENLLKEANGNISKAARLAGKHRVEIYRIMKRHDINKNDFKTN